MGNYKVDVFHNGRLEGSLEGTGVILLVSHTKDFRTDVDGILIGRHTSSILAASVVDLLAKTNDGPQRLFESLIKSYTKGEIALDVAGALEDAGFKQKR
jgi:hypothetical protein